MTNIESEQGIVPSKENNYGLPAGVSATYKGTYGDSIVVSTSEATYIIPSSINDNTNIVYWFHGGGKNSYSLDVGVVERAAARDNLNSIVVLPASMSYSYDSLQHVYDTTQKMAENLTIQSESQNVVAYSGGELGGVRMMQVVVNNNPNTPNPTLGLIDIFGNGERLYNVVNSDLLTDFEEAGVVIICSEKNSEFGYPPARNQIFDNFQTFVDAGLNVIVVSGNNDHGMQGDDFAQNIFPIFYGGASTQEVLTQLIRKKGSQYFKLGYDKKWHSTQKGADGSDELLEALLGMFTPSEVAEMIQRQKNYEKLDEATRVQYDSIVDSVNAIIDQINLTSFNGEGASFVAENSSASIFGDLNTATNYLFGISSGLINGISNDVVNIEQMLINWAQTDADLASLATVLNGTSCFSGMNPEVFSVESLSFEEITSKYTNFLGNIVPQGAVGKISMSDLNQVYNGTLTGQIGASLEDEITDAHNLGSAINDLINNQYIASPGWNEMLERLENYEQFCEVREWAATRLKDAYSKAMELIYNHIAPDEYMDDGEIPQYEAEIQRLAIDIDESYNKIDELTDQNRVLAEVGPNCSTYTDKDGNTSESCDWSPVYAARAQIASNNAQIEYLKVHIELAKKAKKEAEDYLKRLQELSVIINKANGIINEAINDIEQKYATEIYHIDTPRLAAARAAQDEAIARAAEEAAAIAAGTAPVVINSLDEFLETDPSSKTTSTTQSSGNSLLSGLRNLFSSKKDDTIDAVSGAGDVEKVDLESGKTSSSSSRSRNGGTMLGDTIESIHEAIENPSPRPQASEERETVDIGDAGRNALSGAEGHSIDIHKEEESSSGESAIIDQESPQSDETTSQASGNQNGGTFLSDSIESIHEATENPSPRPQASEERETVDIGDAGRNALSGAEGHSIDIHKEEESSSGESAIIDQESPQSDETTSQASGNQNGGTFLSDSIESIHEATENPSPRPQASEERETVDIGDAGRNALSGAEGHGIDIHKEEESSSDESAIIENTQGGETTFVENRDNTIAGTMLNDTRVETHSEVARNTDDTRIETQIELARDTDDTRDEVVMQAETTTSSEERLKAVEERLKSDVKVETAENNDSENFVVSTPSSSSSVSGANPSSEIPSSPSNSSTPVISEPELTENPTNSNQEIISEPDKPVTQEPEGTQETNNPVSQEVNDGILPFVPKDNEEVTVPVIKEEPKPSKPSKIDVTSSKSNVTYKEYEPKILDKQETITNNENNNSIDSDTLITNDNFDVFVNNNMSENNIIENDNTKDIQTKSNAKGSSLGTIGAVAGASLALGAAAYLGSKNLKEKEEKNEEAEEESLDKQYEEYENSDEYLNEFVKNEE